MGDQQLALQRPLSQLRLVQLGVLDRVGRLARHAGQHVEIVLPKAVPLVQRVDLDHPQRHPVAGHQRRAHHRTELKIDDALGHLEPRVARRVGRQDRLPRRHHLFDDRPADPDRLVVLRAAMLDRHGHEPAGVRVLQHDETAVRLGKDRKEAVQQLGQHLGRRQCLAQVVADLDQGLELRLGPNRQPQAATTRPAST